ncbi:basic amino acid ABC transporter substrate-binding protein [Aquibacillus kalidii]|uniref:basic amino acid ABC transporter substrate-binding protein n=1 Tax=Aquibacillus kalidii TaxID=2762597 RepID=UPI0016445D9F|nr:basic amino acid ABC transporter substrate-binding protein [Aquibacillus kalidii]
MKKNLSFLYVGFLLIGMLFLAACGTNETKDSSENNGSESEGNSESAEKKVLQVGTEATFAPFEYMEKGEIVGFDADLLKAVMKEAGLDYEFKNVGWEAMLASVQGEDLDFGVAGITINDKRKESYDFSVPYFQSTHVIVFNEGENITSAADLEGIKVGVQTGTTGADAAEKVLGENNKNISKYETQALAFMALKNGDVSAVVTDNVVAAEYVKNNPDAGVEMITDEASFESEYYGFMFPKGSEYKEEISEALATVIDNGTYQEIYKEWFGNDADIDALKKAAE